MLDPPNYARWIFENPEIARIEVLEEIGCIRQLTPEEEAELESLYRWRDEQ